MNLNSVFEVINSQSRLHDLFQSAPLRVLEQVEVVRFEVGKFALYQNESYDVTYLVVSGQVKVYLAAPSGKSVVLDVYGPGMFIGEQEAIIRRPYSASIVNITPVTLLKIPNQAFVTWICSDHRFADKLLVNLSEQIYHLTKRVERYSLYSALQQVCIYCLQCYDQHKSITREQIAFHVDTSYRNINRVVKRLNEFGMIKIQHSTIRILDPQGLKELVRQEES